MGLLYSRCVVTHRIDRILQLSAALVLVNHSVGQLFSLLERQIELSAVAVNDHEPAIHNAANREGL